MGSGNQMIWIPETRVGLKRVFRVKILMWSRKTLFININRIWAYQRVHWLFKISSIDWSLWRRDSNLMWSPRDRLRDTADAQLGPKYNYRNKKSPEWENYEALLIRIMLTYHQHSSFSSPPPKSILQGEDVCSATNKFLWFTGRFRPCMLKVVHHSDMCLIFFWFPPEINNFEKRSIKTKFLSSWNLLVL